MLELKVHEALLKVMNLIIVKEPERPDVPAMKDTATLFLFQAAFQAALQSRENIDSDDFLIDIKGLEGVGIFSTQGLSPSTIFYHHSRTDEALQIIESLKDFFDYLIQLKPSYRIFGDILEAVLDLNPVLDNGVFISKKISKTPRSDSGAHYTPETLTEELVRATIRPAFEQAWKRSGTKESYLKELRSLKGLDPAMGAGHLLSILATELCREIAFVEAVGTHRPFEWHEATWYPNSETNVSQALSDEQKSIYEATFNVELPITISRSIYGLDVNWFAVEAAKMSLWFLAREYDPVIPYDFLDKNLIHGDALLGLKWGEVENILSKRLGIQNTAPLSIFGIELEGSSMISKKPLWYHVATLCEWFDVKYTSKGATKLAQALGLSKEWFDAKNPKWISVLEQPEVAQKVLNLSRYLQGVGFRHRVRHWDLEFPEVFDREASGFDIIVANPPFLGDKKLRGALGIEMVSFLANRYSKGATPDLSGWFFLRYHDLVNEFGSVGSIGPNSIAQGSNRTLVTKRIMFEEKWFSVYRVLPNRVWPGSANVYYCMVHFVRPEFMEGRKPLMVKEEEF